MRRNSCYALLAFVLIGGCAKQPESVYVDLDAALSSLPAAREPSKVFSKPPSGLSAPSATLPALPEEIIFGQGDEAFRDASELIRKNRVRAYKELEGRLREVYLADVRRQEQEQLALLEPARTEAAARARAALRKAFESYAAQRGPLIVRLALLAGFPDPDPESKRGPITPSPLVLKRLAEAKAIRAQVVSLAKSYNAEADRLIAGEQQDADAELTRIRAGLETARNQAEDRARREAASQVRTLENTLGPSLATESDTILPGVPSRTVPAQRPAAMPAQPEVATSSPMDSRAARLDRLKQELDIWTAVNGYRESATPDKGRDRTSEFIEWIKSHHLGP
jgi:hypothetical protein